MRETGLEREFVVVFDEIEDSIDELAVTDSLIPSNDGGAEEELDMLV